MTKFLCKKLRQKNKGREDYEDVLVTAYIWARNEADARNRFKENYGCAPDTVEHKPHPTGYANW
jgi:hypothetical protein